MFIQSCPEQRLPSNENASCRTKKALKVWELCRSSLVTVKVYVSFPIPLHSSLFPLLHLVLSLCLSTYSCHFLPSPFPQNTPSLDSKTHFYKFLPLLWKVFLGGGIVWFPVTGNDYIDTYGAALIALIYKHVTSRPKIFTEPFKIHFNQGPLLQLLSFFLNEMALGVFLFTQSSFSSLVLGLGKTSENLGT